MMRYKLAFSLFKLYISEFNEFEFVGLNFNQILTGRQTNFISSKTIILKWVLTPCPIDFTFWITKSPCNGSIIQSIHSKYTVKNYFFQSNHEMNDEDIIVWIIIII